MKFCSLYSGSSGNSIFIGNEHGKILVDAGLSGKYIEKALIDIEENPRDIAGIFITHEHTDHIKGVGVLSRKYNIPIFANELTWGKLESSLGKLKDENKVIIDKQKEIKDLLITRFDTPHDAVASSGFTVQSGNKKVAIVTDIGHFSSEIKNTIKDSDIVLIESNHDVEMVKFGPYPYMLKKRILSNVGHLSNDDCGRAILDIMDHKQKHIILGHLSNNNNYPDLAYETVKNILIDENVDVNKDIFLTLAKRDMPSNYIDI
ncbi:MBL fold metallo-hydrolase [Clostridium cellulovorans]|uniref:Beta-lactamase domain protein n=1 Tax=Clostridium cellulovorans (strain ATCC 35296 / DSM 3052 / OCM 3 / 743B) TaxID=573061 RepID=D9SNK1_CLOC7|nr:MBL fold metallo-hydrolase [Clostridium cellulovorans]ADL53993.1 beta-lactamase domain protein [Clostridium cellulovorans 743B]